VSVFVLDASYALTWCFPDRATPNTDATLKRMETLTDSATVPWVWRVEIGNALGKAVTKDKVALPRALEIWSELLLLPIRQVAIGNIPELLRLAVKHNLSVYDTCYLQLALISNLPIATNDDKLKRAAAANGLAIIVP
jgi:predicted nucleic acid-binding protein